MQTQKIRQATTPFYWNNEPVAAVFVSCTPGYNVPDVCVCQLAYCYCRYDTQLVPRRSKEIKQAVFLN